jgi:hypothetical protein
VFLKRKEEEVVTSGQYSFGWFVGFVMCGISEPSAEKIPDGSTTEDEQYKYEQNI